MLYFAGSCNGNIRAHQSFVDNKMEDADVGA